MLSGGATSAEVEFVNRLTKENDWWESAGTLAAASNSATCLVPALSSLGRAFTENRGQKSAPQHVNAASLLLVLFKRPGEHVLDGYQSAGATSEAQIEDVAPIYCHLRRYINLVRGSEARARHQVSDCLR